MDALAVHPQIREYKAYCSHSEAQLHVDEPGCLWSVQGQLGA